jgi:hypothetical protein
VLLTINFFFYFMLRFLCFLCYIFARNRFGKVLEAKTVFSSVLLVVLSLFAESTFGQGTDLGTIRER